MKRLAFLLLINLILFLAQLAQAARVEHVIIISFDGLRADALLILGNDIPAFNNIRQNGVSTLNARADYDITETLPNHATMLTARSVKGNNGHQHEVNDDNGQTVYTYHGSYLASIFDVVHDYGLKTALLASKDKFTVFSRSYDSINGAPDLTGPDNGLNKIDLVKFSDKKDNLTLNEFFNAMQTPLPQLTFLHFAGLDKTGHKLGWDVTPKSDYLNAVREMDTYLQQVLNKVPPATVVIVTADHGGGDPLTGHDVAASAVNYTIPFMVWDNLGLVKPGGNLYGLNTNYYADPGLSRPDYTSSKQPIRNGDSANLALSLLCLPDIPGSTIKGQLDLHDRPNTAPTLTGSLSLTSIHEDEFNNSGMQVTDLINGFVSDPDINCALEGIAVIGVDNSRGNWEYSLDGGSHWNAFGNPSPNSARLLASDTYIRLLPNPHENGQVGITFRAWDQTSGSHGGTADATAYGSTTAFSSNVATANITINAINDPPSFTAGTHLNHSVGISGPQSVPQWASAISPGDFNESQQILTFQVMIVSDSNQVLTAVPSLDSQGQLNYTLTGNPGAAQLKIVLQDDGGTALGGVDTSSPIFLTITNGTMAMGTPNNPPSFIAGGHPNHPAGTSGPQTTPQWATAINPGATTENHQILTFQVTVISDANQILAAVPTIDSDTGHLNYTLTGNSGTAQLKVVLKDDGGIVQGGMDTSLPTSLLISVVATEVSSSATSAPVVPFSPLSSSRLPPRLTLGISIAGEGKVQSDPAGLDCHQSECEELFETFSDVELIPIPASDSLFSGWGGHLDCADGKIFMDSSKLCVAFFQPSILTTLFNNSTTSSYLSQVRSRK